MVSAGSDQPVSGGGPDTPFSIRLPEGAACPGDSANEGYRVQSYMVPSSVPPAEVDYDGLGPAPNAFGDRATFRQPLYDTATSWFVSAMTAEADSPGEPGPIVNIPSFSFDVYRGTHELPMGSYNVGIACTLMNEPVRYWNTELVFEVPDEGADRFIWRVIAAERSQPSIPWQPAAVATVIAGAAFVGSRRIGRAATPTPREEP